jgi:tryptophan synthase alpha chain
LLLYEHSIEKLGYDKFISYCKTNSIEDIILVGLKDETIKDSLIKEGLKISCYVTYGLPDSEVNDAINSNGFVYLQAKPSSSVRPGCETLDKCIKYLKDKGIVNPVYVGVGVSTKDDVAMASEAGADGVFIGSALLKRQHEYEELSKYIKELKSAIIK